MSTVELKSVLIHQISEITDVSFLEALKTILDSKLDAIVLPLTPEQKKEILESQREVEQGHYIEHDVLDKEIREWLNIK
jgi:hypothetical protein